jgi:glycosyltransferase involved in cell wall biosynthesis
VFYYVLPGAGIYGGVKKGFDCAELLSRSGFPCVVATPGGERPGWFETDAQTVPREDLPGTCRPEDTVLFSFPPDARFVDSLPARRKIVHMQGANTRGDVALFRRSYEFVSHGLHMTQQLLAHGRVAPYVPIGVPDVFRCAEEPRRPGSVAVMSRKNGRFVAAISRVLPRDASLTVIEKLPEAEVAETLKRTDVFVAISKSEAFGLPPLEAMCAGCCVVGFPGDGGFEFMRHGETAHLAPNGDRGALQRAVREALERPAYRDELRHRAMAVSAYYTLEREREYLLRALGLAPGPSRSPGADRRGDVEAGRGVD